MKRTLHLRLRLFVAAWLLVLGWHTATRADIISDWNSQLMDAVKAGDMVSPQASRDMAILNTAIYNAVEGISGQYNTFSSGSYTGPSGAPASGASMEAAAAAAASTILQGLYGSNSSYSSLYSSQLSSIADGQAKIDGINYGVMVANDILNWRSTDHSATASDPGSYTNNGNPGHWSSITSTDPVLPSWGAVTTFGISSTAGFTSTLPGGSIANYLASSQYATDYNAVKAIGSVSSGTRSIDQLNAAYFWSSGSGTVTTAGLWNKVAQTVAASAGLNLQDTARLYAAMNVAMADSAIVAWQTKYDVDFWSPLLAIVNGSADGNGATDEDALWQALLNTPNYPGYLAEVSAISAAAAKVLASFLGDNFAFSLGSDLDGNGTDDLLRNFLSFSQAAQEAGKSQVWGGIAFDTSNTDGLTTGDQVAQSVLDNNFAPVPEPAGTLLVILGMGLFISRRRRR